MRKIAYSLIIALSLLSLTNNSMLAQTRSLSKTRSIAQKKLQDGEPVLSIETNAFSIYNSSSDKGFVIVAADEQLPEVLGFSDSGSFDPDNIPPSMNYWMERTSQLCNAVAAGTLTATEAFATTERGDEVEPLLGDIAWDQSEPYNLKTPIIGGENSPTGCVATAMAMIMKYYRYPEKGIGQIEYTTETKKLPVSYDFEKTVFDYDKMLDIYSMPAKSMGKKKLNKELDADLACTNFRPYLSLGSILVNIDTLTCVKRGEFDGAIQFMLFSKDGEYLENIGDSVYIEDFKTNYSYKYIRCFVTMPGKYPDGKYDVFLGSKSADSDEWALVGGLKRMINKAGTPKSFEITKQGNRIWIDKYMGATQYEASEANAVADVMAACGASVKMDYNADESGANGVNAFYAFVDRFGYDRDAYITPGDLGNNDLNTNIIEQIENKRPVYIGGYDNKLNAGHAFVADGVKYTSKGNPMFHINWGWSGSSNGYFLINKLQPDAQGTGGSDNATFSDNIVAIYGLVPEDGINEEPTVSFSSIECDKNEVAVGDKVSIKINELSNSSSYTINGYMAIFLADTDGNEWLIDKNSSEMNLPSMNYYKEVRCENIEIPSTIPSGEYKFVVRVSSNIASNRYGRCLSTNSTTVKVSNPTGITEVTDDEHSHSSASGYDLNGMQIDKADYRGIYIKDNKKILNTK